MAKDWQCICTKETQAEFAKLKAENAELQLRLEQRYQPNLRPAPKCLKCGEQMAWKENVPYTNEDGLTIVMSWSLVCVCGYQTIMSGPLFDEFSIRVGRAEIAVLKAALRDASEAWKELTGREYEPAAHLLRQEE